jgi:Rieske Fe-S protein
VADRADGKCLACPCHESVFKLNGTLISGVSPRDMDPLEIDQEKLQQSGEVWVNFKNFYAGKHERKEKA